GGPSGPVGGGRGWRRGPAAPWAPPATTRYATRAGGALRAGGLRDAGRGRRAGGEAPAACRGQAPAAKRPGGAAGLPPAAGASSAGPEWVGLPAWGVLGPADCGGPRVLLPLLVLAVVPVTWRLERRRPEQLAQPTRRTTARHRGSPGVRSRWLPPPARRS